MDEMYGFTVGERVVIWSTLWPRAQDGVVTGVTKNRVGTRVISQLTVLTEGVERDMAAESVFHDTPSIRAFIAGVRESTTSLADRRLLWDIHRDNPHLRPNVAALPRP